MTWKSQNWNPAAPSTTPTTMTFWFRKDSATPSRVFVISGTGDTVRHALGRSSQQIRNSTRWQGAPRSALRTTPVCPGVSQRGLAVAVDPGAASGCRHEAALPGSNRPKVRIERCFGTIGSSMSVQAEIMIGSP